MRTGIGYDAHQLVENRKLIIGGVEIPFKKGLLGHSDADVLIHAIIDSMLGAAALGDIGKHFPNTDNKYKDISSLKLLEITLKLINDHKYKISNIDATVVMQEPQISSYIPQIIKTLSQCLKLKENQINIKGKTEEGMGFTGKGEGVKAYAICTLS